MFLKACSEIKVPQYLPWIDPIDHRQEAQRNVFFR